MICTGPAETAVSDTASPREVRLPLGLIGLEQFQDCGLITKPSEKPFRWLVGRKDPTQAFILIDPFGTVPNYHPDIPRPDTELLGLASAEDALVFNIVTLQAGEHATVNLKAPIVFNRHTGVGKQVIVANASHHSIQHPLSVAAS